MHPTQEARLRAAQRLIIGANTAGTVTAVAVSRLGVTYDTIATSTAAPVLWTLLPGEFLKLTYTVAPDVVVLPQ